MNARNLIRKQKRTGKGWGEKILRQRHLPRGAREKEKAYLKQTKKFKKEKTQNPGLL